MPARNRVFSSATLPSAIRRFFGRRSSLAGPSISQCVQFIESRNLPESLNAPEATARLAVEHYFTAVVAAVTAVMFESWPLDVVFGLLGQSERESTGGGERTGRQDSANHRFVIELAERLSHELARCVDLQREICRQVDCGGEDARRAGGDLFKDLHHDLFSQSWRHGQGEYYTPDWLACRLLDAAGYRGISDGRLLDPACGSGTFLCEAVLRLVAEQPSGRSVGQRQALVERVLNSVAGIDVKPLAAWTARANLLAALRGVIDEAPDGLPIVVADSILSPPTTGLFSRPFDFVVGNPPWIAWDRLPADYRNATKPMWSHYGLFSLGAAAARHGGAKKDLSMLMVYAAADRYLTLGGRLAMVLPQIVLQSAGSGDGFRRFVLPDGTELGVFRVDDYSQVRVFAASNWTCTLCLEKGRPTRFPVEYIRWFPSRAGENGDPKSSRLPDRCAIASNNFGAAANASGVCPDSGASDNGLRGDAARGGDQTARSVRPGHSSLVARRCRATPVRVDSPGAPWIIQTIDAAFDLASLVGPSEYQAHLGANSGGANGIYWLRVVGKATDGVVVEPVPPSRQGSAKTRGRSDCVQPSARHESMVIEPDLLYPLVRWKDVDRFALRCGDDEPHEIGTHHGRLAILLVQDPNTRTGMPAARLSAVCPRCQAYLERHQAALRQRAAFRRYQAQGPYWSMYNVGLYTISPCKVVWRRMEKMIRAVALGPCRDELLGEKPFVPQETCVFVPCREMDEANYLAALLNSDIVGKLATAQSVVGGKGFGTPGMFAQLNIHRFDRANPRHQRLAFLGAEVHRQRENRDAALREIDAIALEEYLSRARNGTRPNDRCEEDR